MGDKHQRGLSPGMTGKEQLDDLLSRIFVEVARRLVRHHDCWIRRQRARDRDTLLLAPESSAG